LKLVNRPEVALRVAGALGGWDDPRAGTAIGTILKAHGDDPYIAATALSSLTPKNFPAVAEAVMGDPSHAPAATVVERLLAFAVAKTDEATLGKMLANVAPKEGPFTTGHFQLLASLLDALERQRKSLADLAKTENAELKAAVEKLEPAFAQARSKAMDAKAAPADRVAAVRVLGRNAAEPANDRAVLKDLLGPQSPGEVQAAAVAALARTATPDTPAALLKGWKGYSPAVRAAVLSALLSREAWVPAVLTAIEKKEVLPAEVDAAARQQLLTHKIAAVRETASKLLAGGIDADRAKVIAAYKPALTKQGDRERGKQVFTKTCSACHKVGDVGKGLGPDLAALSDKSAEYLLVNILDPNRAVEARYLAYTANTTDGRSRVGFLSAETATSITLVSTDGQEHTILRTDLDSLVGSGKSVMPEGLEKDVSIDQMADLLTFLRSALPAPKAKAFAGNKPERITAAADGSFTLPATAAEIYGTSLVFEPQYRNLGWWQSADDQAVWTVAVPAAGKYEVWIDWACPKQEAGKLFTIEAGGESLSGRVGATAGWEEYRRVKVGEIALESGDNRLTVRATPPFKGILMDLGTVKLVPVKDGKK
jgi:putative heme-binding domain-containing protein